MPLSANPSDQARASTPEGAGTATACIALANGQVFFGKGFGATGDAVAELCFNTAMTGYQEIMTDPSYAGQIVTFTFPHIGNVGANPEDDESAEPRAAGMVVKWDPTEPSNWRSAGTLSDWLRRSGRIGIGGVDTRRLTRAIRQQGAPHVAISHDPEGQFDIDALVAAARAFPGLEGMDLARDVTCAQSLPLGRDALGLARRLRAAQHPRPPGRRHRLRREAQHPALPRLRGLRRHRAAGLRHRRGRARPRPRRPVPVERPRRSGRHRRLCRADDPRGAGKERHAGLRHLPRPPDARPRPRGPHHQDEPRPPRREPPGQGDRHRQGRDHLDEPRLHRRQPDPARRRGGNPRLALRRLELRHRA